MKPFLFATFVLCFFCISCSSFDAGRKREADIAVNEQFKKQFFRQINASYSDEYWNIAERDIVNYFAKELTLEELQDYNKTCEEPIIISLTNKQMNGEKISDEDIINASDIINNSPGYKRVMSPKFQAGLLYTFFSALENN